MLGALRDHGFSVAAPDVQAWDLTRWTETQAPVPFDFELLINCAAYTQVDQAEQDALAAHTLNALVPEKLAELSKKRRALFVHISTDYVFSGDSRRPYTEDDPPFPQSAYGHTKLEGEMCVQAAAGAYYIVRSAGLYGPGGATGKGGHSMIDFILNTARAGKPLRLVQDQWTSPTYVGHLAQGLVRLLERRPESGCYHMVNEGVCSWHEFGTEVLQQAGMAAEILPVSLAEFSQRPAKRPTYSALENRKLNALGMRMPTWQEGVRAYIAETR